MADIGLDVTTILSDNPIAEYRCDDKMAQLRELPIIHYNQSKLSYLFKNICLTIVGIICVYIAFIGGIKAMNDYIFVIPLLFFGYLSIRIVFDELPNRLKGYDGQITIKIYQDHLKVKTKNILGYLSKEFQTIDFKDIYAVVYEYISRERRYSYWAVNLYYLTYSPDKVFYKKNVIELMGSCYEDETTKQFAIMLYRL